MIHRQAISHPSPRCGVAAMLVLAMFPGLAANALANTREIAELPEDRKVVFSRDVAPVLKKNCVACHNASSEEGGVNLETVAKMKASDVEDVLVPGDAQKSRLFRLASHAEDPVMPPEDNDVSAAALNPVELALLRRWIESGAEVDQAASEPTPRQWQPLPSNLQTVYGSAMTLDGRLSAVSFGNQIRLFGSKSPAPIDSLELVAGDQTKPPHDDFVQDLCFDSNSQRVISAGYRNLKFWQMAPFETAAIPKIERDATLAIAMNPSGRHLATLSPRGEVSVAEVGKNRWQWMKGFDFPTEFRSDQTPRVRIAIGPLGQSVSIAWDKMIRVVRIDGKEADSIEAAHSITSIIWLDPHRLVTGDASGNVNLHRPENGVWMSSEVSVSDQPITFLCSASDEDSPIIAIDASGKVAQSDASQSKFSELGRLPAVAASVSLASSSDLLWVTLPSGALGTFNLTDKKFVEVAKTDPLAAAQHASDQWKTLVSEKLIAADDQAVKQAETNVAAEKKSLEKLIGDITTKTTAVTEKQKTVAEAKKTEETAEAKLDQARADEQTSAKRRAELTATVKQIDKSIAELTEKLEALKKEKSDAQQKLAAVPDAKKLADTIKTLSETAEKAAKELATKNSELSSERAALKLAEETKARGELRLKGLDEELKRRQQSLEKTKTDQEANQAKATESKTLADQSQATDQPIALTASGTRVLTRSQSSGTWNLWSGAGDWIGQLPALPSGGQLVTAGDGCVLIQAADGQLHALRTSKHIWQHQRTIGSATAESPFADRVLSLDIDPSGQWLASGGGEPSRTGELMIWNMSDGSLVRRFESPHSDTVLCVRFSPDGNTLATGGADRMIKLWDVATGTLVKSLEGHTHHVTALAWNLNRSELASGSADASVKIWNINSGQSTRTISGLKSEITRLVYLGREDRIGITSGDSHFRVYRTDNGGRETNAKLPGGYLYALGSNRDGTQFVVGGADGVATVVDKSGKQIQEFVAGD